MKPTLEKIWTSDILKIESDFDLLFSFPSYKHSKNGPKMPKFDTLPPKSKTGFFPDMQFSPKRAHYCPLRACRKSKKSIEPFLREKETCDFSPNFKTARTLFSTSIFGVKEWRYAKFDLKCSESTVFGLYENPIGFRFALFVPEIFAFEKRYRNARIWHFGP